MEEINNLTQRCTNSGRLVVRATAYFTDVSNIFIIGTAVVIP